MLKKSLHELLFNFALFLNALLLVILLYGQPIQLSVWLQVGGRLHPLVLHFPIVMILLAVGWHWLDSKQEQHTEIHSQRAIFTTATLVLTAITALTGFFLGQEEGYAPDSLNLHKWLGSSVSLAGVVWYAFVANRKVNPWVAAAAGLIWIGGLVAAAHQGGNLTHGKNFVLAPIQKTSSQNIEISGGENLYSLVIHPILQNKCLSCHSAGNTKGSLNMSNPETFLAGGKHGSLLGIQPDGQPLFIHRILLPADDEFHMPPSGKKQLTDREQLLLIEWINKGAPFDLTLNGLDTDDILRVTAMNYLTSAVSGVVLKPLPTKVLEGLNSDYLSVRALYKNSGEISVSFMSPANFRSEELIRLEKIKENIVELNLSGMPLKEADFRSIEKFTNLRVLNLSHVQLPETVLPGRFSWVPTLILTAEPDEDLPVIQLPPPVIQGDEQVIRGTAEVSLRHAIAQATLRYTLDGTDPDSINASIYSGPIALSTNTTLKTRAFLEGWLKSETAVRTYFAAGLSPDSTGLIYPPSDSYKAKGAKSLTDNILGSTNFRDGNWLGYRTKDLEVVFHFQNPATVKELTVSTFVESGSYIMPPSEIAVWVLRDNGRYAQVAQLKPEQPLEDQPGEHKIFTLTFSPENTTAIKVIARPLAVLPQWHRGKGDKGWLFVDEIFLN